MLQTFFSCLVGICTAALFIKMQWKKDFFMHAELRPRRKGFYYCYDNSRKMTVNFSSFCHLQMRECYVIRQYIFLGRQSSHKFADNSKGFQLSYEQILRNILLLSKDSLLINYFMRGFLHIHALKFSFFTGLCINIYFWPVM